MKSSRTHQSIDADTWPLRAFPGRTGDKWLGLLARYCNASNYHYMTLHNNNAALLRRMVNGTFTTLASAMLPITSHLNYRVRREAIGAYLRVFRGPAQLLMMGPQFPGRQARMLGAHLNVVTRCNRI